jgi:hypothetical protein
VKSVANLKKQACPEQRRMDPIFSVASVGSVAMSQFEKTKPICGFSPVSAFIRKDYSNKPGRVPRENKANCRPLAGSSKHEIPNPKQYQMFE